MGFGRKMGAFLGLVPDDGRPGDRYDDDGFEANEYGSEYSTAYKGEYGRDYGAETDANHGTESGSRYSRFEPADAYAPTGHATDRGHERGIDRGSDRNVDRHADRFTRSDSGYEPMTQGALAVQPLPAPRRDLDSKTATRPVTIKLTGFGEARVIGEKYRDGQSVIMDMTGMDDSDARRLVDFAAGLAFAKRGSIDKVTTKVFMLLPSEVDFAEVAELTAAERRAYATSGR